MRALATMPLRLGARVLARRQARADGSEHATRQERTLRRLLKDWSQTRFGRDHALSADLPYEAFQQAVPVRGYEGFVDYIAAMRAGEPNQLSPGLCRFFAVSSGTTAGPTKYLPVNAAMLSHFRRAGLLSLLLYARRAGHTRVFGGRHLFLGGATALQRIETPRREVLWSGDLSGITAIHLPLWADALLYEPGREIALLEDWPRKIEAIAERTFNRDVRLVAGIPSWLLVLFGAMEARARAAGVPWRGLRSVWPNLECLVHGGVPVEPYAGQLRSATGPEVMLHEVFPASEAFIAAQDGESGAGLRLFDGVGVHYEFLPLDDLDADGQPQPGARAHRLDECQAGGTYALVLSTPGGLCRYLIGDLVRLVSLAPPRLVYVGRTRLQLSAFGEHVIEQELTGAIVAAAGSHGFVVQQFHVAPLFADPAAGRLRGRHEWWVETSGAGGKAQGVEKTLDAELARRNDDYAAKRQGGGLEPPVVRWLPPGSFEAWLKSNQRWGGQNKVPRCRSDRLIADALSGLSARG